MSVKRKLTTAAGAPVADNQNIMTAELPLPLDGAADFWNHREDDGNYFSQTGNLLRMMNAAQKEALYGNTARVMGDAPEKIKLRHIGNCFKADPAYGAGVAKALGLSL